MADPRIVVIGGGTGCSTLLTGLRRHTSRLTAVVTVMDGGGSSGRLREEMGLPALGDLRRCLVALASSRPRTAALAALFEHRFPDQGALQGHSLGNLLLAAMVQRAGGLQEGVVEAARLLGVRKGAVLPVTLQNSDLVTTLQDGTVLEGEEALDLRGASAVAVDQVSLRPPVRANPEVVQAIRRADAIILGPGDLYTSLLPNLLVEGVAEAVRTARGQRIVVGNLVRKPGETDEYRLSDHLREVLRYLGTQEPLDAVLVDGSTEPAAPAFRAMGVETDPEACRRLVRRIVTQPVAQEEQPGRHHPERTAAALREFFQSNE